MNVNSRSNMIEEKADIYGELIGFYFLSTARLCDIVIDFLRIFTALYPSEGKV